MGGPNSPITTTTPGINGSYKLQDGCLCFTTGDSRDCHSRHLLFHVLHGKTGTLALGTYRQLAVVLVTRRGVDGLRILGEESRTRATNVSRNLQTRLMSQGLCIDITSNSEIFFDTIISGAVYFCSQEYSILLLYQVVGSETLPVGSKFL